VILYAFAHPIGGARRNVFIRWSVHLGEGILSWLAIDLFCINPFCMLFFVNRVSSFF